MVFDMAAKTRGPLEAFDDAKLVELTEPITVTVHKVLNGRPCPIVLPPKPEWDVPGKGWSQDEVRQLENFIVRDWSGGGQYHFAATGDNGQQMRWQAYWPVDKYPEKGPLVSAQPSNGAPTSGLSGAAATTVVVPPTPAYMPPPTWMQFSAAHMAAAQPSPAPAAPSTSVPYYSYPTPPLSRSDADRLQEEREARIQLEAKIERERLESSYKEKLDAFNQEMRRLQEQIAQAQARPTESPETIALKAELAEMRKERENDRVASMVREMQQQSERQIAALQQSTQAQIAALTQLIQQKPTGPDPFMMMMIESQKSQATAQLEIAKLQAEAQKEAARLQAESAREAARTSIGPRELIDIMSRAGQGQEQLANGYTRLIEATQQTFENMLNAQGPQVHPALEMLGQGVQGALGVAQRYIEAKENAATNQARAAAAVGQAQAQAQVAAAQLAAAGGVAPPPAPAGQPDDAEDEGDEGEEDGDDEIDAMEQELFGGALDQVKKLRNAVASGQAPPDRIASAILDGIAYFGNKGEAVKAFDLWRTGELAKLIDVLIPDASTSYRGQVAEALFKVRQQANK